MCGAVVLNRGVGVAGTVGARNNDRHRDHRLHRQRMTLNALIRKIEDGEDTKF